MQSPIVKVSGLIITFNEEKNIREVLKCFDFCDEIIVVDSNSTDKTVEIASSFPKVKIVKHPFDNYTEQRNIALQHAKNDWVLFLDADERITPELKSEILSELSKTDKKDAYYFYRKFYFCGKPLHFSGTQKDKNFRLFRKSKAHYIPEKKVHETLEVNGKIGTLKNKLLHYSVSDIDSYRKKMLTYGRLKGNELYLKGKKYSPVIQYAKTFFRFFKNYIFKMGFLDGKYGYQLCKLQSLSVFETYNTLWSEYVKNRRIS